MIIKLSYERIPVKDFMLEKDVYRLLSQMKYRAGGEETSISTLVNDMLKQYLHTYILSRTMGHMIISKDVLKLAVETMNDVQIKEASYQDAIRYKEGAIIEHGRPSLDAYLAMIRAFANANKFDFEISRNQDNNNQVLVMTFHMGDKFARLKGYTYRLLLEEFAQIEREELTGTSIYFEFKPKKQIIQEL